jgi:hypothetical protein
MLYETPLFPLHEMRGGGRERERDREKRMRANRKEIKNMIVLGII